MAILQHTALPRKTLSRGFALLFAMFVSSILLSVGLGIANVIYKELILSSIGRESSYSFYNAQSGLECAMYLNQQGRLTAAPSPLPQCGGNPVFDYVQDGATTTFKVTLAYDDPLPDMCASVSVYRDPLFIVVESRGYNTCDDENPRRVERALRLRTGSTP